MNYANDIVHLYNNLISNMNIDKIMWLGSFDCILFKILFNLSNIVFLVPNLLEDSNSRIKKYNMEGVKFIYTTEEKHIIEAINYFKGVVIFTPLYFTYEGYLSLALSPELYLMMPGSLDIKYLTQIDKPYNFNASVCFLNEELIYSIRSSDSKFTVSNLILSSNKGTKIHRYNDICREDVRLFSWKGELYGSYTFISPYVAGLKTYNKLTVGKIIDLEIVEEYIPKYGGNLTGTVEKNWTWWESPSGKLHCVYNFTPLCILEFEDLAREPKVLTTNYKIPDLVRGGACGVVYEDKVYCFTHTVVNGSSFNVGLVVLSHSDKPEVLGYCNDLIASKDYMNVFFYICGAYFDVASKSWKLTGGVQDSRACVLTISHDFVLSKLRL